VEDVRPHVVPLSTRRAAQRYLDLLDWIHVPVPLDGGLAHTCRLAYHENRSRGGFYSPEDERRWGIRHGFDSSMTGWVDEWLVRWPTVLARLTGEPAAHDSDHAFYKSPQECLIEIALVELRVFPDASIRGSTLRLLEKGPRVADYWRRVPY
jgi:hypothetical protein